MAGLDWPVPDFSTLSRRQKSLLVEIPCSSSSEGLHLLVDSTGIKAVGDGEWCARKHGPSKRRQWRKVHLGIDARTLEIRAVEVTGSRIVDAPMLPELLGQIPKEQPMALTIQGTATTQLPHAMPARSYPLAVMQKPGPRTRRASMLAMKPFGLAVVLAERSGNAGAAITCAAASRPRCIVSSCWVNASWRESLIVRLPGCKSVQPPQPLHRTPNASYSTHRVTACLQSRKAKHRPICAKKPPLRANPTRMFNCIRHQVPAMLATGGGPSSIRPPQSKSLRSFIDGPAALHSRSVNIEYPQSA